MPPFAWIELALPALCMAVMLGGVVFAALRRRRKPRKHEGLRILR